MRCVVFLIIGGRSYDMNPLSAVAENGRTIRNEQEVERNTNTDERRAGNRRTRRIVEIGRASEVASPLEVELASTRHVEVAARLVSAGVQAEVDHEGAFVFGGDDVVAAKVVRLVGAEELRLEVLTLVDINAMSRDTERGDSLADLREHNTARLNERARRVEDGAEIVRGDGRRISVREAERGRRRRNSTRNLINVASEAVPVTPFGDVTAGNSKADADRLRGVEVRAKTGINGLDRPLEAAEELLAAGIRDLEDLLTVDADEREADAADVNVMTTLPLAYMPTSQYYLRTRSHGGLDFILSTY